MLLLFSVVVVLVVAPAAAVVVVQTVPWPCLCVHKSEYLAHMKSCLTVFFCDLCLAPCDIFIYNYFCMKEWFGNHIRLFSTGLSAQSTSISIVTSDTQERIKAVSMDCQCS